MSKLGFQKTPRPFLHPSDLYKMIDALRDGWMEDWHETFRQHHRLEWHLLEMPERFHERARTEMEIVKRAQIVNGIDWQAALRRIGDLVTEWSDSRKAVA